MKLRKTAAGTRRTFPWTRRRRWVPVGLLVPVVLVLAVSPDLTAQSLPLAEPQQVGMLPARLALLDRVVETAISSAELPGAVIVVGRQGRIVLRRSYGHRALIPREELMAPDTVFDLASLTKVVATATSLMILVDDGLVSLADPVWRYLPEFSDRERASINLLQLATHFSGLRPDLDLNELWEGTETAIRLALEERPVAPPGQRFIYSDINYILLAEIVRKVTETGLERFADERIFRPLGMSETRFSPPQDWRRRIAPTEARQGRLLRGEVHDPTARRMAGIAGHAGLFSTADDLARFAQMILNRGELNGVRILSPLAIATMTSPQSPQEDPNWRGVGFDIRTSFSTPRGDLFPVGSFGHTGFTGTSLWIDPSTETFVILLSSRLHPGGRGNVTSLRRKVASVVASAIMDLPPRPVAVEDQK